MNALPINAIIAPAQTSSKPANNTDDTAPQGNQGFGNVLARRVADSSSPSDKNSGQDTKDVAKDAQDTKDVAKDAQDAKDATASTAIVEQDAKGATVSPDIPGALPADMLAALLAQQNPDATARAATPLQLVVDKQSKASTPDTSLAIAAGKNENAPRTDLAANPALSQTASALNASRPNAPAAGNGKPTFTDTLKAMGKNEVVTATPGESLHGQRNTDLAVTVQQPAVVALSPTSSAPLLTASALPSQLTVSTPVRQAGWSNDFSQKITWMATQRDQSAELHLNPPQLGPLDVVLKVSGDQATALFTSPHAVVREAIEQALPKLREMLADNGIMLGNATVSDQASRKDQDDSARAQQGSGNASGHIIEGTAGSHQAGRVTAISRHNGLVDTFA